MRYAKTIHKAFTVTAVSGAEHLVMCPFHPDTSQGHMYVNGVSGLYMCHSCGAKGQMDSMGPLPQVGTDDVRAKLARLKEGTPKVHIYPEKWLTQFDNPTDYWLVERGLSADVVDMFCLGYDVFSNRVTLPLRDMHDNLLGVTYRRLDDGRPKYLHPKGFPVGGHLYGAWVLSGQRKVALVEGQVDAIRCWQEGIPALGLMGARLTRDQRRILQVLGINKVVLMLDNDSAGIQGTMGVYEALRGSGIHVRCGEWRPTWTAKDPDGLSGHRLRQMFASGLSITDWARSVH